MYHLFKVVNMIKKNNKKKNESFSESTSSSTISDNVDPTIIIIIVVIVLILFLIALYRFSYNGKDYSRGILWSFGHFIFLILFPGEFIFYHIGVTSGLKWVLNGNNVKPMGWYKGPIKEALNNFKTNGSPLLHHLQQYSGV